MANLIFPGWIYYYYINIIILTIILWTKNILMLNILLWLKKNESNPKVPKFKVNERLRNLKHKNMFSKDCTENWSREMFIIDSVLKTNPWTDKIKNWNGEKKIASSYEKELWYDIL